MSEHDPNGSANADHEPNNGEGETAPTVFGFNHLTGWMNAVGTIWIFALMVLVNADIFGRDFLDAPVRGTTELVALSIVGIVFLQLPHTLWAGRLTRSDAFLDWLTRRKRSKLVAVMNGAFHLVGAALMLVIFNASLPYFQRAFENDEYVGAIGDFTAPTWPVRLIILIGSAATAIQFLLLTWNDTKKLLAKSPPEPQP